MNRQGMTAPREVDSPGMTHSPDATTSRSAVDQQIAALDEWAAQLKAIVASYRDRPVDWDDVAALGHLQEELTGAVKAFGSASSQVELRRAARRVSVSVRRLADASP